MLACSQSDVFEARHLICSALFIKPLVKLILHSQSAENKPTGHHLDFFKVLSATIGHHDTQIKKKKKRQGMLLVVVDNHA